MAYTDWPKIIQEINQKYGTEFKPDEPGPAMVYLRGKLGTLASVARKVGMSKGVIVYYMKQVPGYKPPPRVAAKPQAITEPVAVIDMDKWHRSGMHRPPCNECPIGHGSKNRPECEACAARIEYANAQAGMPALPGADSMQQVQYMRQTRMSACS